MSEAFLLLRASRLGLVDAAVPLVLAALSLAFALAAYPAGRFSDRLGRHKVVAAGIAFFIAACPVLAVFGGWGRRLFVGAGDEGAQALAKGLALFTHG